MQEGRWKREEGSLEAEGRWKRGEGSEVQCQMANEKDIDLLNKGF
jgi:hypothetical protein